MKAVILAGGEGRRLRPLTQRLPKPLLPLPDRPVINHIIYRLAKAGITEAAITIGFLGNQIRQALGNSLHGVSLTYYEENVPRGTAGSVKNAESFLDDDFIVLCGDGVFDFDLTQCLLFHKESDADVTLVLTRHHRPREYGVVLCDPSCRIMRFLEKPDWTQTFSDTINTGIYLCKRKILRYIPGNSRQDFSSDIFPRLLQENFSMRGYVAQGYWCDIGSPSSYYTCIQDTLKGKIKDILNETTRQNLYKAGSGYYYQAPGVLREEDTVVTAGSVLSENCRLLRGSMVDGAVLFPDVTVGQDSRVDRSVLAKKVSLGKEVRVQEGVVMGENCEVEAYCSLPTGSSYQADTRIYFNGHRPFSDQREDLFDVDGIPIPLSTEEAVKVGRAVALAAEGDKIFIMRGSSGEEALLANEVSAGIMLAGKTAKWLGEGHYAMAVFAASTFRPSTLVFVTKDGNDKYKAILLDDCGLPLSNLARRRVENMYYTPFPDKPVGKSEQVEGCRELYLHSLVSMGKPLPGKTFYVSANQAGDYLSDAMTSLSANIRRGEPEKPDEMYLHISDDGRQFWFKKDECTADFDHIRGVILQEEAKRGIHSFSLPYLAPRIYDTLLSPFGATLYRYLSVAGENEQEARSLAAIQPAYRDGAAAAVTLIANFTEKDGFHENNLMKALTDLPPFQTVEEEYFPEGGDENKASLLARLSSAGGKGKEGIAFSTGNGFIAVTPRKNGFRIIAQSYSMEAAHELCTDMKGKIRGILGENENHKTP